MPQSELHANAKFKVSTILLNREWAYHVSSKCQCQQCLFFALDRWRLASHIEAVHEAVRKFPCDQCEYRSKTNVQLKRHEKRIHGITRKEEEPQSRCALCPYASTSEENLTNHLMKVHVTEEDSTYEGWQFIRLKLTFACREELEYNGIRIAYIHCVWTRKNVL